MSKPKYIPGDWVMYKGEIAQVEGVSLVAFNEKYEYIVRFEDRHTRRVCEFEIDGFYITPAILEKNEWKFIDIIPYPAYAKGVLSEYCLFLAKDAWNFKYNGRILSENMKFIHELQHILFGLGIDNEMEV